MTSVNRPTDGGVRILGQLLSESRDRVGLTDWGDFAAWLAQNSDMGITKDAVYKVFVGNYKVEPPFRVFYALAEVDARRARSRQPPIFTFRDGETPITLKDVGDILYGRKDANGLPINGFANSEPYDG